MFKNKITVIIAGLIMLHMVASSIIPLPDPSEARYAAIAKHMSESGNYIMPQIWMEGKLISYMGKPPFAFWVTAASIKVFGANEFAVRFPSFIASMLLLGVIFYVLQRYRNREVATSSILIAATSAGFYIMSGVVLVDSWLFLFSIGAVFLYYAFISENSRKLQKIYTLFIFVFLGLGFLTKGPVALLLFGLPVFVRCMEYSSYFYGGHLIFPHGKEKVEESLRHHSKNYEDLFVMKRKYFECLPEEIKQNYSCAYKDQQWAVLEKDAYMNNSLSLVDR